MYIRPIATALCLAFFTVTLACAQTPPPQAAAAPARGDAQVMEVLNALKTRGQNLQDFTADVIMTETDGITAAESQNFGNVKFQRKSDGNTRVRVTFDRKKIGARDIKQHREYRLDDGKLVDQNFESKLQVTRQVLKPGQKLDPLKLGEGPFPLPIGQEPEAVQKEFAVKRIASAKEDPANTAHISLKPKPDTRFVRKFESIDVFVDEKTHFPVRIEAVEKGGATVRTTDLSNIKINTGLTDADFRLLEPARDWGVRDEELAE
jgi:outer membrane lipoprotein-sorting protein